MLSLFWRPRRVFRQIWKIASFSSSTYYPWTLDEYKGAITDTLFYNSVADVLGGDEDADFDTRIALVVNKMYFAGISGRWMFAMTTDAVKRQIVEYVDDVHDFESVVTKRGGEQTQLATNHLRMTYADGHSFIVSKEALRLLISREQEGNPDLALQRAYELAGNNNAHRGWVFELDFRMFIESNAEIELTRVALLNDDKASTGPTKIDCGAVVHCDLHSLSSLADEKKQMIRDGARLLPVTYGQAGWDAAYIENDEKGGRILNMEQVTCGGSHAYDMKHAKFLGGNITAALMSPEAAKGYWTSADPKRTKECASVIGVTSTMAKTNTDKIDALASFAPANAQRLDELCAMELIDLEKVLEQAGRTDRVKELRSNAADKKKLKAFFKRVFSCECNTRLTAEKLRRIALIKLIIASESPRETYFSRYRLWTIVPKYTKAFQPSVQSLQSGDTSAMVPLLSGPHVNLHQARAPRSSI